jgi:Tfp pilus assembly protein PilZ
MRDPSNPARSLAVYGPLSASDARTLRAAASAVGVEPRFFESPAALGTYLETDPTVAVLVAAGSDGALEVLTHVRSTVRYASTPLVGITDERTDLAFGSVYECGGDDLVSARSLRALVSRLRPLVDRRAPAASPMTAQAGGGKGWAAVATCNLRWRNVVGRVLLNAGIDAKYFGNAADAVEASGQAPLFVIGTDDLPPEGGVAAVKAAAARGSSTPWLVAAPPKRVCSVRAALDGVSQVAVVDMYAPPDNLLFTANELRRPQRIDQRTSARVLFGTAVSFRAAGGAEDDVGFTYNVSAGGIYVRTLAPLDAGQEVWLELWPPRCERTVRLVGRVAWRRSFGPSEVATVPPGFGVQLTGGLPGDVERWETGVGALVADRTGPPLRPEVWQHMSSAPPPWIASAIV